jgi:uncharacterized protein YndB with AHSA1/START domain
MTTAPSTDYQKTLRVQAAPDAVFDAVTSAAGLTAWWTEAEGSGDAGGELRFSMSAPEPLRVHVDEATRPTSVRWTVTECTFEPDWVGTHPTFTITPVAGDASELEFRHVGLTDELECIDMCTAGWNHYLASLRSYVETGRGNPRGSEADMARRQADEPSSSAEPAR